MTIHHRVILGSLVFLFCAGCASEEGNGATCGDLPGACAGASGASFGRGDSGAPTGRTGPEGAGGAGPFTEPDAGTIAEPDAGAIVGTIPNPDAGDAGGSSTGSGSEGGVSGCGGRTTKRGKTSRTVTVNGTSRTFIAQLPESLEPGTPVPLVYVFHGASQTGANMYEMTQYAMLADKEKFAVVFPDGQGTSSDAKVGNLTPWNVSDGPQLCGLGTLVNNPNPIDFAFLDAIKAELQNDQCIDSAHVFATGFSMGGYFSHHIACDRPDFRAAAPHSGATMADLASCKTSHMPIIIFHGLADTLINSACSDPNVTAQAGFPAAATLWAKKNGCQNTYKTIPQPGTTAGNDGNCYLYDGCPADGQVELCTFTNLPHAWAGSPTCPGCIGAGAGYASATQLEWEFFKKYAW